MSNTASPAQRSGRRPAFWAAAVIAAAGLATAGCSAATRAAADGAGAGGTPAASPGTVRATASSSPATAVPAATPAASAAGATGTPVAGATPGAASGGVASGAPTAGVPTLGQPTGVFAHGVGFGQVKPPEVFNGGDPTGLVTHVTWRSWGGSQAVASGVSDYVGPGQPVVGGTEEPATVVAFDLGTCDGKLMYRAVEWYFPQHHQAFNPGQYEDICTGTYVPGA